MIRVFIGVDRRTHVGANVLAHSIERNSSVPVQIVKLYRDQLPIERIGLTEFTYTRYLVPYLCGYEGQAIFMDSDMLCLGDVAELADFPFDDDMAVATVDVTEFERPSLMVFNNVNCADLTPELIQEGTPQDFTWGKLSTDLPVEWNYVIGYAEPHEDPKLVHYTMGIPMFPEISALGLGFEAEWWAAYHEMNDSCSWLELMGPSVHADRIINGMKGKWAAWQQLKASTQEKNSNTSS